MDPEVQLIQILESKTTPMNNKMSFQILVWLVYSTEQVLVEVDQVMLNNRSSTFLF